METFVTAFSEAGALLVSFDRDFLSIVGLSLRVSLSAVALACLIGFPLGAFVALARFPGRGFVILLLNTFMGLPPVVVGLIVFLVLSRAGPLGVLGLLFTPAAMIIAQTILVTPIVAALTRQIVADLWVEYGEHLRSLDAGPVTTLTTLIMDARYSLTTVVLAGFGRAIAEVGAVMIVGGNIDHATRVMTTAIALETSQGNLSTALGLGIVLLLLALTVNAAVQIINTSAGKRAALA
ncbi:MAG: ABC transporter permease [Rhodospirillaceae bacterium]|jgi:tungstate transport system permease protein|nr:ABC transporter permease [Rhodospirillaceae bacterium]MBT3808553.1 ABC transporter permease [Rhodospirillaceae bacterium]MBT3931487.1 ABC transporter permease [Rhodospirillaceae bacterium]MBT4773467.1 ABC transporter permease [Rhodospirillaceae bacterium]MBT5359917.1 ABC transporter permease [Rhodospirillaceae bacterium]